MKRSNKFYRQNEKILMKKLGLKGTYNSGSGWLEKEDGESEYVICQLKSTDASIMSIKLKDIMTLETHAITAHKVPLFILQFLQSEDIFALVRLENIPAINEYINTGCCDKPECIVDEGTVQIVNKNIIRSGDRTQFWKEKDEERIKWKRK